MTAPNGQNGPQHDGAPHPAEAEDRERAAAVALYTPTAGLSKMNEASSNVLAARAAKEIEARTLVALGRPRNLDTFRLKILAACARTRFAEAAMYSKPIGGKDITGLSIRFAEECARHYQNLDINSFAVSEDDERRVFEVVAVDLETNVRFATPVVVPKTVWRLNPKGEKPIRTKLNARNLTTYLVPADDDSLLVLQSNMLAKAQREVILKHIPSDVKEEAEEAIEKLLRSQVEQDPDGEKKKIVDGFFGVGVMPAQLDEFLGHALSTVNPAELHLLRRLYRGIRDEGSTWAQVIAEKKNEAQDTTGSAPAGKGAAAGLKKAAEPKTEPKTEPKDEAPKPGPCDMCGRADGTHGDACPLHPSND